MQVSIKQIVAASLLTAASASAFATATVPGGGVVGGYSSTTPLGDNGGLTFSLFSKNGDTSFSLNNYLGLDLNSVVPTEMNTSGMVLTWHIEGLNNVGSVAQNDLVWGVTASDNGSTNVASSIRLATTVNSAQTSVALTNANIGTVTNTWNTTVNSSNNAQNSSPVDFTTTALSPTDLLDKFNTNDGISDFSWTGGLTDTLSMYLFSQAGAARQPNLTATATQYAGTWAFDFSAGTLTYSVAPVPLPAAVWLLLSGLAGMGVVSRRKNGVPAAAAA